MRPCATPHCLFLGLSQIWLNPTQILNKIVKFNLKKNLRGNKLIPWSIESSKLFWHPLHYFTDPIKYLDPLFCDPIKPNGYRDSSHGSIQLFESKLNTTFSYRNLAWNCNNWWSKIWNNLFGVRSMIDREDITKSGDILVEFVLISGGFSTLIGIRGKMGVIRH